MGGGRGVFCFFFFNDTATTEIYTLSLHDALPILELFGEVDRWKDLAQLESFYRESIKSGGFRDRFDVNRESVRTLALPDGMEKVLLLGVSRSEEHTSELQSLVNLVCRLLLEKNKKI